MSEKRKRPTLADVAVAAGVSKTAASLALNDKPTTNVSADKKRRILVAANELGFRPHGVARALSRRRADVLGVVGSIDPFVHESEHLFEQGLLAAIFRRTLERGYNPLIYGFPNASPGAAGPALSRYGDGRSDAFLLLNPPRNSPLLAYLHETAIPTVTICFRDSDPRGRWVDSDHEAGVRAIVEHLAGLGHKRIGYFVGPVDEDNAQTRSRAFRNSMQSRGLEVNEEWIVPFRWEAGRTAERLNTMFRAPGPPTALLAWNDYAAEYLIAALREWGLDVPRDVSVAGFDDTAAVRGSDPALTTVRQNLAKMGSAAVDLAVDALCSEGENQNSIERRSVLCSIEFIARASTGLNHGGKRLCQK